METEDEFWALIEASRRPRQEEQEAHLEQLLENLAPQELIRFQAFLDAAVARAYRWDLWAAAYVILGGCSDDGFEYFRRWLVAQGRGVYEAALVHPDSLIDVLPEGDDDPILEFEELSYLAPKIWDSKQLTDFWDSYQPTAFTSGQPTGAPWEEEDLPVLVPRLFARFNAEL